MEYLRLILAIVIPLIGLGGAVWVVVWKYRAMQTERYHHLHDFAAHPSTCINCRMEEAEMDPEVRQIQKALERDLQGGPADWINEDELARACFQSDVSADTDSIENWDIPVTPAANDDTRLDVTSRDAEFTRELEEASQKKR